MSSSSWSLLRLLDGCIILGFGFKIARLYTLLQGFYGVSMVDPNNMSFPSTVNTGIAIFEMEYGHWIEEQNRHICELRNALNAPLSDVELKVLVEGGMNHYFELFKMKAIAARSDIFYVMCGMWKTSSERFFQWIGGFRPSELLKVTS